MDLFAPQRAIKYTLWPASRKNNNYNKYFGEDRNTEKCNALLSSPENLFKLFN